MNALSNKESTFDELVDQLAGNCDLMTGRLEMLEKKGQKPFSVLLAQIYLDDIQHTISKLKKCHGLLESEDSK